MLGLSANTAVVAKKKHASDILRIIIKETPITICGGGHFSRKKKCAFKADFRSRQITSKKVVQFEGSRGQIRDSTPRKDIKPQKQQCSLNLTHSSRSKPTLRME